LPHDPAYLSTAIRAALAAGRVHRQYFRQNPEIQKKGPVDLVTQADLEVEREFRRLIADQWPSHAVLGEEQVVASAAAGGRIRWIIDPLDGTTNFAHGLAVFCVSIALEVDGRIELGVVYDPVGEELFTAERGLGARLNGLPIRVSSHEALIDALLCTGFPYAVREQPGSQVEVFAGFLATARAVRRLGSAALDLCYVAAGRLDGFWELQLQPWDMAAAGLIVEEAGGRISRYDGQPVDLFRGQIVASNGHLHGAMSEVIARHHR
jgi:myo-inositol-1(or 4)-monophosphatase